jgi:hypothetical protein
MFPTHGDQRSRIPPIQLLVFRSACISFSSYFFQIVFLQISGEIRDGARARSSLAPANLPAACMSLKLAEKIK